MSGGEPSSIKRNLACAAGAPALSRTPGQRIYHNCQRSVCGLALHRILFTQKFTFGKLWEEFSVYQALYRKWRPRSFDDVVGQEHITQTLKRQLESGRLSHAYLFVGTRGTGKTTCAKILAKAANCLSPINGNPCNNCPSCYNI